MANLNQKESDWIKANPWKAPAAWWNSTLAENFSKSIYMCQHNGEWVMDIDGTNQNAFKYAYWSALNVRSFDSEVAQTIGDNHEIDETSTDPDTQMDVFNNQLGRKVAETCGCDGAQLRQQVQQAIYNELGKRRRIGLDNEPTTTLISTSSATTFCNDTQ